jgi:ABC-2 type transport system permease protein
VEGELTHLVGRPVRVNLDTSEITPRPDSEGPLFLVAVAILLALTIAGATIVPHLMIEEKQTRTLDALLVSPARSSHLVIAKALTGLFYCLTIGGVVLAFNAAVINHWGLAILTTLLGSLFTVALGLLLGSLFEVKQQLTMWGFVLIAVLLIPVFLSLMRSILPDSVGAVISWIPTVALSTVFRVSFSGGAPLAEFGPQLALVVAWTAPIMAATVWIVRRSDR